MKTLVETLKDFVGDVVGKIIDEPESLEITVSVTTKEIFIHINCDSSQRGMVIGRHGATINALNVICSAVKNTHTPDDNRRLSIVVLDDEDSEFCRRERKMRV